MRSFAVATVALMGSVSAQTAGYISLNTPNELEAVPACQPYVLNWTPSELYPGPVQFQLIGGETSSTLQNIGAVFGNVDSSVGTYTWDVPCDQGADNRYGLKIELISDPTIFQFSKAFTITPVADAASSAAADTTTTPVAESTPVAEDASQDAAVETVADVADESVAMATSIAEPVETTPVAEAATPVDELTTTAALVPVTSEEALPTTMATVTSPSNETTPAATGDAAAATSTEEGVFIAGGSSLTRSTVLIVAIAGAFFAL